MIHCLVTDLDGTLFKGHGKTIFDLTKENIEALQKAKEHGIKIIPCSGRSISYCLRLASLYDFPHPLILGGLNGAIVYNETLVESHTIDNAIVKEIYDLVEPYHHLFQNVQAQDTYDMRIYYDPFAEPARTYRKESGKEKCSQISDMTLKEYIDQELPICKFSIVCTSKENSLFFEELVRKAYDSICTITRSSETFLEINPKDVNKGNFVCFVKNVLHLKSDEIAVIGDEHNDSFMFSHSEYSFAMSNGSDLVKKKARYVVDSVAQCIDTIIEINKKDSN